MASGRSDRSMEILPSSCTPRGADGEQLSRRRWRLAAGAGLTLLLAACGEPSETALKNAKPGDVLVKSGQTRVTLVAPFQPGVANGLYKGVVRVSQPDGGSRL